MNKRKKIKKLVFTMALLVLVVTATLLLSACGIASIDSSINDIKGQLMGN